MNVATVASQSAVLELQVDGVVFSYRSADVLDMTVPEFPDSAVSAAQQILVQVENRDIEDLVQLFFQAARVGGYPAQIVMARNQRQPLAPAAGMTKGGGGNRPQTPQRRLGFDFERRHGFSLSTAPLKGGRLASPLFNRCRC
jgi:hypothetical protein